MKKDECFFEEKVVLEKTYSLEEVMSMDIIKCEEPLRSGDDIIEFKRVYQLITARYDGLFQTLEMD